MKNVIAKMINEMRVEHERKLNEAVRAFNDYCDEIHGDCGKCGYFHECVGVLGDEYKAIRKIRRELL